MLRRFALRLARSLSVLFAGACLAPWALAQDDPPAAQLPDEAAEHENLIKKAFRDNPALHGAWVLWNYDATGDRAKGAYMLKFIVDAAKAEAQEAAIRELIASVPLERKAEISFVPLPVSEFVDQMAYVVEADATLNGCQIEGAFFGPLGGGSDGAGLYPYGRAAGDDQRQALVTKFSNRVRQDAAWNQEVEPGKKYHELFVIDGPEMLLIQPADSRAASFFAEGHEAFWDQNYARAVRAMDNAILEDASDIRYRYWRVMSHLCGGDKQRAYNHLIAIMVRFDGKLSDEDSEAMYRALERIQGPARSELAELQAMAARNYPQSMEETAPETAPPATGEPATETPAAEELPPAAEPAEEPAAEPAEEPAKEEPAAEEPGSEEPAEQPAEEPRQEPAAEPSPDEPQKS